MTIAMRCSTFHCALRARVRAHDRARPSAVFKQFQGVQIAIQASQYSADHHFNSMSQHFSSSSIPMIFQNAKFYATLFFFLLDFKK